MAITYQSRHTCAFSKVHLCSDPGGVGGSGAPDTFGGFGGCTGFGLTGGTDGFGGPDGPAKASLSCERS